MIIIESGKCNNEKRLGTDITTQRGFADDLEMALNGCYPSIRQLDNSPMITHWKLSARPPIVSRVLDWSTLFSAALCQTDLRPRSGCSISTESMPAH